MLRYGKMGPSVLRGYVHALARTIHAHTPVRIERGVRFVNIEHGSVTLGRKVHLYEGVRIDLHSRAARVSIGALTFINRRSEIIAVDSVSIGERCAISWDVSITDTDGHQLSHVDTSTAPVTIGNHVWIGARATILKGVTIGDGAVIAAGSIVTRDVPAHTLVAGAPAKVVRTDVAWT